jgi:hypothetical protein
MQTICEGLVNVQSQSLPALLLKDCGFSVLVMNLSNGIFLRCQPGWQRNLSFHAVGDPKQVGAET